MAIKRLGLAVIFDGIVIFINIGTFSLVEIRSYDAAVNGGHARHIEGGDIVGIGIVGIKAHSFPRAALSHGTCDQVRALSHIQLAAGRHSRLTLDDVSGASIDEGAQSLYRYVAAGVDAGALAHGFHCDTVFYGQTFALDGVLVGLDLQYGPAISGDGQVGTGGANAVVGLFIFVAILIGEGLVAQVTLLPLQANGQVIHAGVHIDQPKEGIFVKKR